MKNPFSLLLLPLQAPMLVVLMLISAYLGMHWSLPVGAAASAQAISRSGMLWWMECLQAMVVVVISSIPDLLLRQVSALMIASRVTSLVVTLLIVIMGGLYLLHLDVLSNVLILATSVMLARLDLARIRIVDPPLLITSLLCVIVLGGLSFGRLMSL
ncbi:MAG: hypothetical protein VKK62_03100 [Synechococcaceae cyanobacterium]|nr:hypothetical protein [Synechococcaceae cyanobacterium]